jgi:hypothetical protein
MTVAPWSDLSDEQLLAFVADIEIAAAERRILNEYDCRIYIADDVRKAINNLPKL